MNQFQDDDTFVVTMAASDADIAEAEKMATDVAPDIIAPFEPYQRPAHDDNIVINGITIPQTPADESLQSHLDYENQILRLLRAQ